MIRRSIASIADNPSDRNTLRKAEALAKNLGSKFARCERRTFCLWYTQLIFGSEAVPSKAFLEDQAEKEPSERERAEKERAKRELAKRQKPQSYDDFEPISISELNFAFSFMVILTRFSALSKNFKMSNWRSSWERSSRRHVIQDTTRYDNVVT